MKYRSVKVRKQIKKRILILCEGGKTEPIYFNEIKRDRMLSNQLAALRILVHDTKKNTAKELVAEAIALKKEAIWDRNPYDKIWIVVDRDGYTKHPESFDRAYSTEINVSFSSVCFEFWILLHFEYTSAAFPNCDSVIRRLKEFIPDYEKSCNYYELLRKNTNIAIQRGEQIIKHWQYTGKGKRWEYNPYTDVGILVDYLLKL